MGIKNEIEKFAASKNITLRDYQKSNLRNIERDYENKKIDKAVVVSKVVNEFRKEGRLLSSGEQRELAGKIPN
ncbi:MAG: hypothetical protein ACWGHO_01140 [Candidatus Moraniibacteriota bacterium]